MNFKRLFKWAFAAGAAGSAGVSIVTVIALARSKQSTKDYIKSVGGYHRLDRWPHGLFYLAWTNDYLRLGRLAVPFMEMVPKWFRTWFGQTYHGKLVPLAEAQKLVSVTEDIEALNLEQIVPYTMCKDIILKGGDSIAVCKCFCRHTSHNHCYPDEVCIGVGEPLVTFLLDHQPDIARKVTSEEAMEILRETDEAGCLHAAFFKDALGGRFYAICNCCKCCCVGVEAARYKGVPFFGHSGLMPSFDAEKCTSCGKCVDACIFECMTAQKKSTPRVDLEVCMGCGVCGAICPSDAVTMVKAPNRPDPLLIDELPRKK